MTSSALAPGFHYDGPALTCEGTRLSGIAAEIGTPCYVYSASAMRERYEAFDRAFAGYPHALHYALKANSTLAIARLLRGWGASADANSGGEIEVALRAGYAPAQIVFTGVGKTREEIDRAVALGLKAINAESAGELARIDEAARARGVRARVALRVNPDIDAESHPHISTGLSGNKFGLPARDAVAVLREASERPGLHISGLHLHVGSQIRRLDPLRRAAQLGVTLAAELRDAGIAIDHLDVGGGLAISYDGGPVPTPADYGTAILDVVRPSGIPLVAEPGRAIVGPAGVLIGRVVDVKPQGAGKHFVVLDTGMTELLRPALYGAFHRIVPVTLHNTPPVSCDIVGPLCETSDTLGADRDLPLPRIDDLLAVLDAGAYGAVMGSNYNRRMLPPEVLVEGAEWRLIRRRQTIDDVLALES